MVFCQNKKSFESLESGFSISEKKIVFCLGRGSWGTPFLHKLGRKIVIFRGFSKKFSELLDSN